MTEKEIIDKVKTVENIGGMTVNERLYMCGLSDEFDRCLKEDKNKADFILKTIGVDLDSIIKILQNQENK